jgi:hypothetical protein
VEGQEVITFERAQVAETGSALHYQVRVQTREGEAAGEFPVPFAREQPGKTRSE